MTGFSDDDPETVILMNKYKQPTSPLGNPVCVADWATKPIPPRVWIWEDWIPLGESIGLYGPPGIRKTDLLLQLCMAAPLGLPFCGMPISHICTYGLFCEDSEEEIIRRCKRIADFYGRDLHEFTGFHFVPLRGVEFTEFVSFDASGRMAELAAFQQFKQDIAHYAANLAVLDTAPDFFGGDEIKRRQVTQFLRCLDGFAMQQNCTIIFTAHPSRSGISDKTFSSGSTGWEGKVRVRLTFRDPAGEEEDDEESTGRALSDRRILRREKSNYARQGDEIEMVFRDGGFMIEASGPTRGPLRDLQANTKFLELLEKVRLTGDYVNNSHTTRKYAPSVFGAHQDRAGFTKPEFYRALGRLLGNGSVRIVQSGARGREHPEVVPS